MAEEIENVKVTPAAITAAHEIKKSILDWEPEPEEKTKRKSLSEQLEYQKKKVQFHKQKVTALERRISARRRAMKNRIFREIGEAAYAYASASAPLNFNIEADVYELIKDDQLKKKGEKVFHVNLL